VSKRNTAKKVKKATLENEKLFRLIAENSLDYIFQTSKDAVTIYCSPAIKRILGYRPAEIEGNDFTGIISPDHLLKAQDLFKKVIKEGKLRNAEVNLLHKNGSTVTTKISLVPIAENKKVTGVFGIAREITVHRDVKKATQREKNKLDDILKVIEDEVWIIDREYVIQYGNAALEKNHGPAEGRKCYEYFYDLKKACPWCANEKVFAGKTIRREW
jgi:PAS domain S-box-containing protein